MKAKLKDNMTRDLVTIKRTAKASDAYKVMMNNWFRHLPVTDETGEFVVGMLSDRDLLRSPDHSRLVQDLMTSPVRTFDIETPMKKVVTAMIDEKLSAFMIMKNDEIAGIVTTEDMLLLLSQYLNEDENTRAILGEFLVNPAFQSTMNSLSQAGI